MRKASVYVVNRNLKPANYYRIVQYAEKIPNISIRYSASRIWFYINVRLVRRGKLKKISLEFFRRSCIKNLEKFIKDDLEDTPEYIIVQKSITKFTLSKKLRNQYEELIKRTNVIWDFDDNIVEGKEIQDWEFNLYCKYAKHIIVTSEYLKNILPKECQDRVILLPTTDMQMPIKRDELEKYNKIRRKKMQKEIEIIWLATRANLPHLESVIDILDETAKEIKEKFNKKLVLRVVCGNRLKRNAQYLKIKNVKWTRNKAIKEVRRASIGIMPLKDGEYSKGKGGFKLIQYISTGLPIIASNVGYNNTIFKDDIGFLLNDSKSKDSWKDSIIELVSSEEKWDTCSKNAYDVWEKYFNYKINFNLWKGLLGVE